MGRNSPVFPAIARTPVLQRRIVKLYDAAAAAAAAAAPAAEVEGGAEWTFPDTVSFIRSFLRLYKDD